MEKYTGRWNTSNPRLIIFLIDQSSSMGLSWYNSGTNVKSKAEKSALLLNRILEELILHFMNGEICYNRAYVHVIGYSDNNTETLFKGLINDLADNPLRFITRKVLIPGGDGAVVEIDNSLPVWIESKSKGMKSISTAFDTTKQILEKWILNRPDTPVPLIINISDGFSNKTNESKIENQKVFSIIKTINSFKTALGESSLLLNVLVNEKEEIIQLPDSNIALDENARLLFKVSSFIPKPIKKRLEDRYGKEVSKFLYVNSRSINLVELFPNGSEL